MKLFWSGIVKNESARLERCMKALIDHVDGAIILDTGSTDATIQIITDFFAEHKKPCEIAVGTFETWDQARNDALKLARNSVHNWDYLFLVDVDMELVVNDPRWRAEIRDGAAYEMVQEAGTVVYTNARLVSRLATGNYRGVTHEFLDVPSVGCIRGARFRDHADGANRTGKALRDAALLRKGLEKEPQNGRYWYYLGQSLKDAGRAEEAIPAFVNAVRHSNWDEERWNAQQHLAHCYDDIGDEPRFVHEMFKAYEMRPSRAEALYDLAKHFRIKGQNNTALVFAELGLTKPLPGDRLFVNSYPYRVGFKEEFAICGFYDESRRARARAYNDELSLSNEGEGMTRLGARQNMFFYLEKLTDLCPNTKMEKIEFTPPAGYVGMNPSLSQIGDLSVRCVNYTITPWGSYDIRKMDSGSVEVEGAPITRDNPIHTRNFVRAVKQTEWVEVAFQAYKPEFDLVRGAEDMRIFRWNGALWSISNFRDRNPEGRCEQHLARINTTRGTADYLGKVEPQDFPRAYAEKNWMPWVNRNGLRLIHRLGTVLDRAGHTVFQAKNLVLDVQRLSGGGGLVDMGDGRWLAIVHEAQLLPGQTNLRYYYHRFATINGEGSPLALSRPFVFHDKQIEFAAGLALVDDKLLVSYGVRDCEPWLASLHLDEVKRLFI
jgi:tetratricopeptide (TPR) repeat protein